MITENGTIQGDFEVTEDLQLNGMIIGNVIVKAGVSFHLNGTVSHDLIVESGAIAIVNGMVSGNVSNLGGTLKIYGVVNGGVDRVNGNTYVDPRAIIKGNRSA
jgi:cytoskeletal protein CcmA (bactofilin family)